MVPDDNSEPESASTEPSDSDSVSIYKASWRLYRLWVTRFVRKQFCAAKWYGLFIAGVVLAFIAGWLSPANTFPATARVLGLLGPIVVSAGLLQRDPRPRPWHRTLQWVKNWGQVLSRPQHATVGLSGLEAILSEGSGLFASGRPLGTTEEQLEQLRKAFSEFRSEVNQRLRDEANRVTSALQRIESEHSQRISSVESDLAKITVSGIDLEWVGVLWLFTGMVISLFG
jgi:hypothetical protein